MELGRCGENERDAMSAQVVSILSDIAVGGSAIVIAVAAIMGLRAWRKEMTGKARFEVSRTLIHHSLKAEDLFKLVRSPMVRPNEWYGREVSQGESSAEAGVLNEWYARSRRLEALVDNLRNLQEAAWEANIVLGGEAGKIVGEAVTDYRWAYAEIASTMETYFGLVRREAKYGDKYEGRDFLNTLRNTIYPSTEDKISKKVKEATNKLESALRRFVS